MPQSRRTVQLTPSASKRTLSARPEGPRSGTAIALMSAIRASGAVAATVACPGTAAMPEVTIALSWSASQV